MFQFRAEWDNYGTKQGTHPQPHWQFYQFEEYSQKLDELREDNQFSVEEEEEKGFLESLKNDFDFKKFHFAMSGNWMNNETHVHSLDSEEKIIRWLQGLLSYLKEQLEWINKNKK